MLFSKIIEKKFDAVLGRYDGDPAVHYDEVKDFPQLSCEQFAVEGDQGVSLQGSFYYEGQLRPDRLIIFDHGIGAGHLAYLKEISYLTRFGYTVYAYDHTGCVSTGGTGILGFAQGINDLDHVLNALNENPRFAAAPRKLIGHSWGGYASMNVAAIHPEVTHIVSLAGFLSAKTLVEQYIPRPFLKYSGEVMDRERLHNPAYADMDARESLQNSSARFLHLQSRDDSMVRFELAYEPLSQALKGRSETEFVALEHRNHDPQRTEKAAAANQAMLKELNRRRKKKLLVTPEQQADFRREWDWDLITQQDPEVWERILSFLQRA